MSQLPTLIADLALILICAGVMTLLFKKLSNLWCWDMWLPVFWQVRTCLIHHQ